MTAGAPTPSDAELLALDRALYGTSFEMADGTRIDPARVLVAPWDDPDVEWRCEQHPGAPFPHDVCAGPGVPFKNGAEVIAPATLRVGDAEYRARRHVERGDVRFVVDGGDE